MTNKIIWNIFSIKPFPFTKFIWLSNNWFLVCRTRKHVHIIFSISGTRHNPKIFFNSKTSNTGLFLNFPLYTLFDSFAYFTFTSWDSPGTSLWIVSKAK